MANKCGDATWRSWINANPVLPPNDGEFDTGTVSGVGAFNGHHTRVGMGTVLIDGRCKENPHFIEIDETDNLGVHHKYWGNITTVNGKDWVLRNDGRHRFSRTPIPKLSEADLDFTQPPLADDDWTAEKTT